MDKALLATIEKLWETYDKDGSNALDRDETRQLLKDASAKCPPPHDIYDESKFEQTFLAIDKNRNGKIEKSEMLIMLKAVTNKK